MDFFCMLIDFFIWNPGRLQIREIGGAPEEYLIWIRKLCVACKIDGKEPSSSEGSYLWRSFKFVWKIMPKQHTLSSSSSKLLKRNVCFDLVMSQIIYHNLPCLALCSETF